MVVKKGVKKRIGRLPKVKKIGIIHKCKDCKKPMKYKYETVVCFHCHQKRLK